MKRIWVLVLVMVLMMGVAGCAGSGITQEQLDAVQADLDNAKTQLDTANADLQSAKQEAETLQQDVQAKDGEIQTLTAENTDLKNQIQEKDAKLAEAEPWFQKTEAEQQAIIEEQKKQEEAEQQAAAEKEKQGYDTGITFDQMARTPDEVKGEKVKFSGKVIQVMDGDTVVIRFAVNSDYDKVIMGTYSSGIVTQRVLENDKITIYGVASGLYTYEATSGASITIPLVLVDKID